MKDSAEVVTPQTRSHRSLVESEAARNGIISHDTHVIRALDAFCYVCGRPTEMTFSMQYGWQDPTTGQFMANSREHLLCRGCGLNNQIRATVHTLDAYYCIGEETPVYLTEQTTRLFPTLRSLLSPNLMRSEFLSEACPLGQTHGGIRNEDMTRLTSPGDSLAGVLSFDVLAHVPACRKGLAEVRRCLAPAGGFAFSAPFDPGEAQTLIRAEVVLG